MTFIGANPSNAETVNPPEFPSRIIVPSRNWLGQKTHKVGCFVANSEKLLTIGNRGNRRSVWHATYTGIGWVPIHKALSCQVPSEREDKKGY